VEECYIATTSMAERVAVYLWLYVAADDGALWAVALAVVPLQ
jgi:hypothetical protein